MRCRSSLARPSLLLAAALSLSAALSRAGGLDTASGLPPTPASLRRTRRTSRIAAGALAIDSGPVSPRIPSHRPSGGATAWTFWPLWCFYSSPTAPSTLHRAPSTTTAVDSLRCTPREACVHFSRCSDRSARRRAILALVRAAVCVCMCVNLSVCSKKTVSARLALRAPDVRYTSVRVRPW